ncbi:MAG: tetratricopeptide repeat protein [Candidatus Omnitrophica bacterium]|nr:tetratricopeptide repeat protein [Candidatus Omnitrophota bacterium]
MLNKKGRAFIRENLDRLSLEEMSKELGIRPKKLKREIKRLGLRTKKSASGSVTPPYKPNSISAKNRKKIAGLAFIIFLVTFLVYLNTLGNDFIWDDEYLILNNSQIKSFSHFFNVFKTYVGYGSENVNNFYRPLQELSNMVDYFLWSEDATGFHFTNSLLHAFCAVLVFILIYYISGNKPVAFLTGIFFGVHPIHTEAVAYIAGRADSLYSIFFLLAFIFLIRHVNRVLKNRENNIFMLASGAFFVFALLAKEISMVFPLIVVLYTYIMLKDSVPPSVYNKLKYSWIPYAVIVVVYISLRLTVLNFFKIAPPTALASIPFPNRILTFFKTILVYFKLLLFPVGLHMERTIGVARSLGEPDSFVSLLAVLGAITGGIVFYKKNKAISFFIFWFFINLLPVSNIYPINSFIAEHWLYMASVGCFFIAAVAIYAIYQKSRRNVFAKTAVIALTTILVLPYSVLTVKRNADWKDEITFFENTLRYSPRHSRLYLNLGNTYFEKKEYDKAIEQYEKAIVIKKNDAESYSNIGSAYMSKGNLGEAEKYLKKSIVIKFNLPIAHYNLARIYYQKGKTKDAIEELEISIKQLPQFYGALNELGEIHLKEGNKAEAAEMFEESLRIMPDQPRIKNILKRINP